MSLSEYRKKRNFSKTPEPSGGESSRDKLAFVVQQHHSSHQHYDFRLEIRGVLFSWAIPKGPSMDPQVRRLAMPTEDHPMGYLHFEGKIPAGQYGGGTVIVWDTGWYEPLAKEKLKDKNAQEHWMHKHWFEGALEFTLHGKKLKGAFILIRFRDEKEAAEGWRLIKVPDRFASSKDILLKDRSVISGLRMAEMAEKGDTAIWQSNRGQPGSSPFPKIAGPMLATRIKEPFNDTGWLYEVKFDGYRILASKHKGLVKLTSRGLQDYTPGYPLLTSALREIPNEFLMDGELVVLNEKGHPDFQALQNYKGGGQLAYYAFDLLWLDGMDLQQRKLTERREKLRSILPEGEVLRFSRDFPDGIQLFEAIRTQGLEGIVCKRKDSAYVQSDGRRHSREWLKVSHKLVQEFIIGGYTESTSAHAFRSLLFGSYERGKLKLAGHVGGGFKEEERPRILQMLKAIETQESPFDGPVKAESAIHWVKPELVIMVSFSGLTNSGQIRKPPAFIGFRTDKKPDQVTAENEPGGSEEQRGIDQRPQDLEGFDSNWKKVLSRKITSQKSLEINGFTLSIDNIEQQLWPGIQKAQLFTYYHQICPVLLRYLKQRPLSLHIKDNGPNAPGYYIKDMEGRQPDFMKIFSDRRRHPKKGRRSQIDYPVAENEASLFFLVNMGCIDFNPWSSKVVLPNEPDFISIDLDPSDGDFRKVIDTAQAAGEVLGKLRLKSVVKTSGKTGLHVFIPCRGFDFVQARRLAEHLCELICSEVPEIATTEVPIGNRGDKLFVDPSQNDYADTLASAYSLRPYSIPTVSTPLRWSEIKPGLDPAAFTMNAIPHRVEKEGDLFADLFNEQWIDNNMKSLQKL